jgi:hypothetical protein
MSERRFPFPSVSNRSAIVETPSQEAGMKRFRDWSDMIGLLGGAAIFVGFLTLMALH